MMNPNILNKNPLMFFDRAVNAQRSQLLTVMAEAVSECRTAADQAAEPVSYTHLDVYKRQNFIRRRLEEQKVPCPTWWNRESFAPSDSRLLL